MPPEQTDQPSATETALAAMSEPAEAPETAAPETEAPATSEPAAGDKPSKAEAFLDAITDDPNAKPKDEASTTEGESTKPGDKPADKPAADPATKPAEVVKTPDQEEAELLDGVKSERGRDRIKKVFAEKKEAESTIKEFRELVNSTGMSPQDFSQTLEFGRLVRSNNEADLRVALEMVEGQRAALYAKLGVEAPGIDLLEGHDDLKSAVADLEMPRDKAVELAKHRRAEAGQRQRQQAEQQNQQQRQQFEQTVTQASGQMEQYLATRAAEVDHPARMKIISDHFRDPAKMQEFVSTYQPHQWAATVKMMYDNIQVPRQQPAPQPLRSRPSNLGAPTATGSTPMDRVMSRMDAMGL